MSSVPRLNLAPKLKRRLYLWNPIDYVRLLGWVLFFPQALRWYVQTFADGELPKGGSWQGRMAAVWGHPVRRGLFLTALIVAIVATLLPPWLLEQSGVAVDWAYVALGAVVDVVLVVGCCAALGMASGVVSAVALGITFGVALGVLRAVVLAVTRSVVLSVGHVVVLQLALSVAVNVVHGVVLGAVLGIATAAMLGVMDGVADGMALGMLINATGIVILGLACGVVSDVVTVTLLGGEGNVMRGVVRGLAFGVAGSLMSMRPEGWLLGLPTVWEPLLRWGLLPRVTPLPLPGLRRRVRTWLVEDWSAGLHNVDQLLRYSRQVIPIVSAVNDALATLPEDKLLPAVAQMATAPYDWDLVRFATAALADPRLDTPARAAAAGFWHLHQKEPSMAVAAFSMVRTLPFGEGMHSLSRALAAAYAARDLPAIAALPGRPEFMVTDNLRVGAGTQRVASLHPAAWDALAQLQRAAQETQILVRSISRSARSPALNRAQGELTALLASIGELPEAERELLRDIATCWQAVLLAMAGEVGQVSIAGPVPNPYVVGDPVLGRGFVGRDDIVRRLQEWWTGTAAPPSVVLFGHRRMGKTSILRNLPRCVGPSVHVAYLNLHLLGDAPSGVGEGLLALADSVAKALQAVRQPVPVLDAAELEAHPYRAFEQYLEAVRKVLGDERLILAVDEFEQLEAWMSAERVPKDLLKVLRGYIQMDPHIAFVFAGLHTLEEMTADYFEPFFASVVPVKVSFLSRGAVFQLLDNPTEDFPLRCERKARERVWALTAGQPYLVQLVGHRLVSRFNDLTFERGQKPRARFSVADVEAVLADPAFYEMGRYYFTGVWGQAGQAPPGQQDVLRALAPHPRGCTRAELLAATGLSQEALDAALSTLVHHDVLLKEGGRWRYAVELMRKWVGEELATDGLRRSG